MLHDTDVRHETLLQDEINRVKALETWLWRGLKKRSWRDKVHTDEVFVRVNEDRCLIKIITQRQKNWIGYMLRGDDLLREVMEGRLNAKKRAGKPRKVTISGLEEAFTQKKDEKVIQRNT